MSRYRTPLSRARGLGAAHHGAGHWISERVSALALVPLVLWAVYAAIHLAPLPRGLALMWLEDPLNAVLMVLTFLVAFWHMHSGLRVVIEDYVDTLVPRTVALVGNLFICVLAGGLAIFSILKIAFGGAL
ncbi:MAG: succinate dehydrogenase,hydrophobic rane anchor protein [Caulobacter sp.]|jgi:succinate dehydrogenase / fumarate reductase membrane anchor subunit|nr:succinate dehydrogenase,hydrophobic rane anchor protein [Caulobacter sp.]